MKQYIIVLFFLILSTGYCRMNPDNMIQLNANNQTNTTLTNNVDLKNHTVYLDNHTIHLDNQTIQINNATLYLSNITINGNHSFQVNNLTLRWNDLTLHIGNFSLDLENGTVHFDQLILIFGNYSIQFNQISFNIGHFSRIATHDLISHLVQTIFVPLTQRLFVNWDPNQYIRQTMVQQIRPFAVDLDLMNSRII